MLDSFFFLFSPLLFKTALLLLNIFQEAFRTNALSKTLMYSWAILYSVWIIVGISQTRLDQPDFSTILNIAFSDMVYTCPVINPAYWNSAHIWTVSCLPTRDRSMPLTLSPNEDNNPATEPSQPTFICRMQGKGELPKARWCLTRPSSFHVYDIFRQRPHLNCQEKRKVQGRKSVSPLEDSFVPYFVLY